MKSRLLSALAVVVLTTSVATACTPGASPSPSPTPTFSTEAEAFAAAEETYRAYVDALNQVDLSDPGTFEPVFAWTTGDANAQERKSLSEMHADGWVVSGDTRVLGFEGKTFSADETPQGVVTAVACSDVSDVSLIDGSGTTQVNPDRPDSYSLQLTFEPSAVTSTGFQISTSSAIPDAVCNQ